MCTLMVTRTLLVLSVLALGACVTSDPSRPEPASPSSPGVKFFGDPPVLDQSARIGTQNAAQSFTPAATPKALKNALRTKWTARAAKSTPATTMAAVAGRLVVGTAEGTYVLDAQTGEPRASMPASHADPSMGAAVDGDSLVFATKSGRITKASLGGVATWSKTLGATVAAAPALADVNGDATLDVVIGTGAGVVALDGASGRALWQRRVSLDGKRAQAVEVGVSIADTDRDGKNEVIAAGAEGLLVAIRLADGSPLWQSKLSASLVAPPVLADMDAHGASEILVAQNDGAVAIFDGANGGLLWSARVERDDGQPEGIVGTPTLLPGPRTGSIAVPTARWGKTDGMVILSENDRRFRSLEGRVTSSPVVLRLDPTSSPDVIFGTEAGDVVALDATGGRTFLATVRAPIVASPLVTDVDGDGVRELIVITSDGALTCFSTGAAEPPIVARYRGNGPGNQGSFGEINLGWTFARGRDVSKLLQTQR